MKARQEGKARLGKETVQGGKADIKRQGRKARQGGKARKNNVDWPCMLKFRLSEKHTKFEKNCPYGFF